MTDELVQAPATTALEPLPGIRPRPNQWFIGIVTFLAVVGVGSAVTLVVRPPVSLRIITVEKKIDRPVIERVIERQIVQAPAVQMRARRVTVAPQPVRPLAHNLPSSDDCKGDPLCGLSDLKR